MSEKISNKQAVNKRSKRSSVSGIKNRGNVISTAPLIQSRPSPEQIAFYAYHLWECGGKKHGRDLENWLEAEKTLMSRV